MFVPEKFKATIEKIKPSKTLMYCYKKTVHRGIIHKFVYKVKIWADSKDVITISIIQKDDFHYPKVPKTELHLVHQRETMTTIMPKLPLFTKKE